jgi:hypothetical protein
MAKPKSKFPMEITVTVEEEGKEGEFLCVQDDPTNASHGQKVATYRLVEVRTCKVTTVLE